MEFQAAFELPSFLKIAEESGDKRQTLYNLARIAEGAERYDDMCKFMRELVVLVTGEDKALTGDERNLLSVAYKNVIGARRASWRVMSNDDPSTKDNKDLVNEYKGQIEAELNGICTDSLDLLENFLQASAKDDTEAAVFFLKMTGDYYRYWAESVKDKDYDQKAANFYEEAFKKATDKDTGLTATHPIRLGLALNYSVCFYEILKQKQRACALAKEAFDDAISKLDKLPEADYKDSTLIMQLLRDNLTLWTAEQDENEGDDE